MDIYEKDCKNMGNMEISLSKQLAEECEKEFNISLYDMSHPISANLHNVHSNKKETMKMASTVIRKRDGIFCYCAKITVFDKIKNVEKIFMVVASVALAAIAIEFIVSKINEAAREDIAGADADGNITTATQG